MFDAALSRLLKRFGARPCLRVYGKARHENNWRVIDVASSPRRNCGSEWPLMRGTCITLTSSLIVVGWDFARGFMAEQIHAPASPECAVLVHGGRLHNMRHREKAGVFAGCSYSEVMAHECGHTAQAIRLGAGYLPLVGAVTLFREGERWWNHWENDASAHGMMGGIVEIVTPIEKWQ
jgi:hypothetical protein